MGSDAEVYIFDDARYLGHVVPTLRRFVRLGATTEWLDKILSRLATVLPQADFSAFRGLGFAFDEVCNYLGRDFSSPPQKANRWSSDFAYRTCPSATCSAIEVCPLHQSRDPGVVEDFKILFEACVVDQCLGRGQFLGRTVNPLWYFDTLDESDVAESHPLRNFLKLLEGRGHVVGYESSYMEGIHGWLTAGETKEFAALLNELKLPAFEMSFEAMFGFSGRAGYAAPSPYTFDQLSLAFLRTVSNLAKIDSKGILWGNDLSTYWREDGPV